MKHTAATKGKLSKMHSGKGNPMYGRKHSEEAKRKIGIASQRANGNRQYELEPMKLKSLNEYDAGYLAGIIDGEGSIGFKKDKGTRRPFVTVYGSSKALML